jgi:hypothetical protein
VSRVPQEEVGKSLVMAMWWRKECRDVFWFERAPAQGSIGEASIVRFLQYCWVRFAECLVYVKQLLKPK